jgi:UDPglucose 6-dehydrogenase
VSGKRIAVLGFAFKADTNDTRESPAIQVCRDLLEEGAELSIHDPKVDPHQITTELRQSQGVAYANAIGGEGGWIFCPNVDDACNGADAVVVLTEWGQFRDLNWSVLAKLMRQPAWVFDSRNVVDAAAVQATGLRLWRLGCGAH